MHVTLESLLKDNELKTSIKNLVRWSGRSFPHEDSQVEASPVSASSVAEAVSDKKIAGATDKIRLPSESNGVQPKDPVAVR